MPDKQVRYKRTFLAIRDAARLIVREKKFMGSEPTDTLIKESAKKSTVSLRLEMPMPC